MAGTVDVASAKVDIRRKQAPFLEKKVTPRTTLKRLPWLDPGLSQGAPAIPLDGYGGSADGTRALSPKASVATILDRVTKSTASSRRKTPATSSERRIQSTAGSSLSPVTRHRLSQVRRSTLLPNTATSSRNSRRASIIQGPPIKLPIAPRTDNERDTRPRDVVSLAPMQDHIESPVTPDSTGNMQKQKFDGSSSPAIDSRVQLSPTQPTPDRGSSERIRNRRISNAVEDLEDMVQEAVEIADENANKDQVQEIYEIIEDARNAIQEASADQMEHFAVTYSPLHLSESSENIQDIYDPPSPSSYGRFPRGKPRLERTSPPMPLLVQRNILRDTPNYQHGNLERTSISHDWAYVERHPEGQESPMSSLSTSEGEENRRRSDFSTRSDLLLPPQTVQTASRDHVDFVLRPMARDHSRGRARRRVAGTSTKRSRQHRHQKTVDKTPRSVPRHRRHRSSSFSHLDTSFDEGESPVRSYGNELSVREQAQHHTLNLRRHHRRQPIARKWSNGKKRFTALVACINTALLGIIVGVYAGEVPRIQYFLADERHIAIVGNVVLYFGLAISTFVVWPLPLLHGRKPYVLAALAIALPLQFPQAIVVGTKRSPNRATFRTGLLCARAASGLVLGVANVNYITVLLDLFGASLQSKNPHQEFTVANDVRRHGGGMGMWLGIWSWCWIGSLAVGFQIGAAIIETLSPDWGFYLVVIMLAAALVLSIIAPETRRAPYRKSVAEVYDREENYITRRVSRGEVKLHISAEGPQYWFEEVWAGMKLTTMMLCQPGFLVLSLYLGWIYAQIVLVIVLLGALLSRDYKWPPRYVGAGVMSIAIGAFLAIPLTKAGIFSRERKKAFRTDSMTFQKQVTWSSHLVRRAIFTLTLPLMGLAYTVSAAGAPKPYMVPIVFAGAVGFLSILAIAECHGLIMETFDTCDLQPGVNTRHRLESLAVPDRRRRTDYTSFPRVTAGIFASQTFAFLGAAVATMVGGSMTRRLGAQASTGVTAGILLGLTILLTAALWRFKHVQVIPNHTFGTRRDTAAWQEFKDLEKVGRGSDWKAVVIGNPSGKMRRMSALELGGLSRWTEIRKLNFLIKGKMLGEGKERRERW